MRNPRKRNRPLESSTMITTRTRIKPKPSPRGTCAGTGIIPSRSSSRIKQCVAISIQLLMMLYPSSSFRTVQAIHHTTTTASDASRTTIYSHTIDSRGQNDENINSNRNGNGNGNRSDHVKVEIDGYRQHTHSHGHTRNNKTRDQDSDIPVPPNPQLNDTHTLQQQSKDRNEDEKNRHGHAHGHDNDDAAKHAMQRSRNESDNVTSSIIPEPMPRSQSMPSNHIIEVIDVPVPVQNIKRIHALAEQRIRLQEVNNDTNNLNDHKNTNNPTKNDKMDQSTFSEMTPNNENNSTSPPSPNTSSSSSSSSPTTVETFFGFFLIVIAALSLVGWAYVFYVRCKHSKQMNREELQHEETVSNLSDDDDFGTCGGCGCGGCCSGCCGGGRCHKNNKEGFSRQLNTPPRSSPSRSPKGGQNRNNNNSKKGVVRVSVKKKKKRREDHYRVYNHDPHQNENHPHPHRHRHPRHGHASTTSGSNKDAESRTSHSHSVVYANESSIEISMGDDDEDDDSFARELMNAARADQNTWAQVQGRQKAIMARKRVVPSLRPPEKDVEKMGEMAGEEKHAGGGSGSRSGSSIGARNSFGNFDGFGLNRGKGDGNDGDMDMDMDMERGSPGGRYGSPRTEYLPSGLLSQQQKRQQQQQQQQHRRHAQQNPTKYSTTRMGGEAATPTASNRRSKHMALHNQNLQDDDIGDLFHPRIASANQQNRPQSPPPYSNLPRKASDPSLRMLPSDESTSDPYSTSATSSSYAGRNSSVEEGEHAGENGFELVGYGNNGNDADGMNAFLLNPVPVRGSMDSDDDSFGNSSGMEMSLGANTRTTQSSGGTEITTGRGSEGRGFFVINGDNDKMHEYIPKHEYDAAVMAAAAVLKNSPNRNFVGGRPGGEDGYLDPYGQDLRNLPSDERRSFERNAMLSAKERMLPDPNDSSSGFSVSIDGTNSFDPVTNTSSMDSSTNGSEPTLSHDVYKELKNVSAFIRRYEQKKSKKQLRQPITMNASNDTIDFSIETNTYNSSSSRPPSVMLTSASDNDSAKPIDKEEKKKRFRRPTFARKKKGGYVRESDLKELEVNVKPKKKKRGKKAKQQQQQQQEEQALPPRHPSHESDEEDDEIIMISNATRPESSRRNQLPIAGNGAFPGLRFSPSGESAASDAKFLRNEIESFFSQKDSSVSAMSESIEIMHRPAGNKPFPSQSNKAKSDSKSDIAQPQADIDHMNDTTFMSENTTPGEFNRLGAAPFNPKESRDVASPFEKEDLPLPPPASVRDKRFRRPNTPVVLPSPKNDTEKVYPQMKQEQQETAQEVPLSQSARSMLQTGAKSIASMMDRKRPSSRHQEQEGSNPKFNAFGNKAHGSVQNREDNGRGSDGIRGKVAGLETRFQTGAKTLMSTMFGDVKNDVKPAKDSNAPSASSSNGSSDDQKMSTRISSRLERIRYNIKERTTDGIKVPSRESANRNSSKPIQPAIQKPSVTNRPQQHQQQQAQGPTSFHRVQRLQRSTYTNPDQMISPAAVSRARMNPGRLSRPGLSVSQQSGDETTEARSKGSFSKSGMSTGASANTAHATIGIGGGMDIPTAVNASSRRNKSVGAGAASVSAGSIAAESVGSSSARNLISMFESKGNSGSGIFPPGEHWQYTGRLKNDRRGVHR